MDWNISFQAVPAETPKFQYPLRVEMDWNQKAPDRLEALSGSFSTLCGSKWIGTCVDIETETKKPKFQYPLRVEMDWNRAGRRGAREPGKTSFSTLCGSKWIGTVWSVPAVIIDLKFQYPLRVEMDWNIRSEDTVTHQIVVSVPSAGRNGLELRAQIKDSSICVKGFSTLCGSKWIGTA